jgi:hypothetical protein
MIDTLSRLAGTLALLAAGLAAPTLAHGQAALFRDYQYNAPIADFGKSRGFYDCSKEVGTTARCVDKIRFLDLEFTTQAFLFDGGQLKSVILVMEMTRESYVTVMKALPQTFALVAMQAKSGRLDVLELKRRGGGSSALARISEFETTALNAGYLNYIFLEGDFEKHAKHATVVDAILKGPLDQREVDVMVEQEGSETYLRIAFSLPGRAMKDIRNAPAKTEKF